MVTVTIIAIIMTLMAYGVMLMLNRQIADMQSEIGELYQKQRRYDSRLEDCEEILLDTAKRAGKHEQQYANIIAKQKENETAIRKLRGYE